MYNFFQRHRFLEGVCGWAVLIAIVGALTALTGSSILSPVWRVPLLLNVFALGGFAYVNFTGEPAGNRMNIADWLNRIQWINGLGLLLHATIGFFTRDGMRQLLPSLWSAPVMDVVITVGIYALLFAAATAVALILKQRHAD
ncbi:MAG: DUF805 domain-containing protein [Bifidobacterium crudilactis]|jgi:hypothetical protein